MRYLSMIRINENTGQVPSEKLMQDMGRLIDEMTADGTLVRTAGLRPTRGDVTSSTCVEFDVPAIRRARPSPS